MQLYFSIYYQMECVNLEKVVDRCVYGPAGYFGTDFIVGECASSTAECDEIIALNKKFAATEKETRRKQFRKISRH